MNKLLMALTLLLVSGCAGATIGNPQGKAGITQAEFSYSKDKGLHGKIISGREHERTELAVKSPEGVEVHYSADGTKAFEGQKVRAGVEKAVSAEVGSVLGSDVVKTIVAPVKLP